MERIIRRSTTISTPNLSLREARGPTIGDVEEVTKVTIKINHREIIIMKAKEAIIMTDTIKMITPRLKIHGRCPPKAKREEVGTSTKVRPRQPTTTRVASNLPITKKAQKKEIMLQSKKRNQTRHLKSKRVPQMVILQANNSNTRSTRRSTWTSSSAS
jgi:hypothetical protein